jgi:hypothetical protein
MLLLIFLFMSIAGGLQCKVKSPLQVKVPFLYGFCEGPVTQSSSLQVRWAKVKELDPYMCLELVPPYFGLKI